MIPARYATRRALIPISQPTALPLFMPVYPPRTSFAVQPVVMNPYWNEAQMRAQMASQQMASQQMTSQQMASQQMASQQMVPQQMPSRILPQPVASLTYTTIGAVNPM